MELPVLLIISAHGLEAAGALRLCVKSNPTPVECALTGTKTLAIRVPND